MKSLNASRVYAAVVALVVFLIVPSSLRAQNGQVIPDFPNTGDVAVRLGSSAASEEFVVFDAANIPLVRALGTGLVGIGTASPQEKLHIQGGRLAITAGASTGLSFQSHDTLRGGYIQTKVGTDYNTAIAVFDAGVGIGTGTLTMPLFRLHVKGAHNSHLGFHAVGSGVGAISFFNEGNTAPIEGRLNASMLTVYTNGVERLRVAGSGHVGVGTIAPNVTAAANSTVLTISSAAGSAGRGMLELGTELDTAAIAGSISFFNRSALAGRAESAAIQARADAGGTANDRGYSLVFQTKADAAVASEKMRISSTGKVGIGTAAPTEALDVAGTARFTKVGIGTVSATHALHVVGDAHFTGTVTGNNIQAHYQDLAEWVPAAEELEPGSVVVLDPSVSNQVMASSAPYDTTVAGVVSLQPGIILGVGGESKEQIATTGRVKVRVDATAAPIRIGDLLVTSGKRGMAMRSSAIDVNGITIHRPGTLIGKALEPLDGGEGEILVLLSLQ